MGKLRVANDEIRRERERDGEPQLGLNTRGSSW